MSEFLKSAMGYFNTGVINPTDNEFVGQIVEVGAVKLRVKRVIAEGKFSSMDFYLGAVVVIVVVSPLRFSFPMTLKLSKKKKKEKENV